MLRDGGELCVCDLAWILERAQNLVSHHLRALRAGGLVDYRRDGKMALYTLTGRGQAVLELVECNFGFSNVPPAGQVARIMPGAPVGGIVGRDSPAWAAEQEACKDDNREKLREPPGAQRRHLFVVVDGSSGTAFSAASQGLVGRLPELCDPITTVWVAGSARVLVTTPPGGWEEHVIPQEVFDDPDHWIEPEPERRPRRSSDRGSWSGRAQLLQNDCHGALLL